MGGIADFDSSPGPLLERGGENRRWTVPLSRLFYGGQPVAGNLRHGLFAAARPDDFDAINPVRATQPYAHRQFGLRQVTPRGHHLTGEHLAANAHFDQRADGGSIGLGPDQFEADPMVTERLIIPQQKRSTANLGYDNVQIAVPVDIGKRRTAAHYR